MLAALAVEAHQPGKLQQNPFHLTSKEPQARVPAELAGLPIGLWQPCLTAASPITLTQKASEKCAPAKPAAVGSDLSTTSSNAGPEMLSAAAALSTAARTGSSACMTQLLTITMHWPLQVEKGPVCGHDLSWHALTPCTSEPPGRTTW